MSMRAQLTVAVNDNAFARPKSQNMKMRKTSADILRLVVCELVGPLVVVH